MLLRARAIENQLYVAAAAQFGETLPGRPSYGRSLIADPWGIVLAQAPDEETVITAELDRARLEDVRAELPSLAHRQPDAYRWPAPRVSAPRRPLRRRLHARQAGAGPRARRATGGSARATGSSSTRRATTRRARAAIDDARAAPGARARRGDLGRVHRADRARDGRRRRRARRECAVEMTRGLGAARELRALRGRAAGARGAARGTALSSASSRTPAATSTRSSRTTGWTSTSRSARGAHGKTKPHESIFRAALERLGVEPRGGGDGRRLARGRRRGRARARDARRSSSTARAATGVRARAASTICASCRPRSASAPLRARAAPEHRLDGSASAGAATPIRKRSEAALLS